MESGIYFRVPESVKTEFMELVNQKEKTQKQVFIDLIRNEKQSIDNTLNELQSMGVKSKEIESVKKILN